ncbi:MAG TPA: polyphenol oxidase family protein [Beutenbergiaceae bacterium]|nr:polyphenol oxidase family protein [Beutenbergiaceae bacterium]
MLISPPAATKLKQAGIHTWFTTREAGNLDPHLPGLSTPEQKNTLKNRKKLQDVVGHRLRFSHHEHGTHVLDGATPQVEPYGDAWCATIPGGFSILAADCLPVLFADPAKRVVAAAHAGRIGLLAGVLTTTVEQMRARGAENISALIGPRICGKCYEISPSMAQELHRGHIPIVTSRWGGPALDLPAIASQQLAAHNVEVWDSSWCTLEDSRFFSHRSADRGHGRHAAVIALD